MAWSWGAGTLCTPAQLRLQEDLSLRPPWHPGLLAVYSQGVGGCGLLPLCFSCTFRLGFPSLSSLPPRHPPAAGHPEVVCPGLAAHSAPG